jgi:sugar lactone lactonase YvrE
VLFSGAPERVEVKRLKKNSAALAMLLVLLLATPILFTTLSVNAGSEAYVVAEMKSHVLSRITSAGERTVIYEAPSQTWLEAVVVDSSGNYLVTESSSDLARLALDDANTLSKITPEGIRTVIRNFSGSYIPIGCAIDSSGNYIVAEADVNVLSKITPDGARTVIYDFSSSGIIPGAVMIDSSGNYITIGWHPGHTDPLWQMSERDFILVKRDSVDDVLLKVTPAGVMTVIYNFSAGAMPVDFAIDSSGNYVVAEDSADTLSKVTPDGERTVIYNFQRYTSPSGVAIDSSGDYIVAEADTNVLSKITPDGVRTVIYDFGQGSRPSHVACVTIASLPTSTSTVTPTTWILVGVAVVAVVAVATGVFVYKKRK